MGSQRVSHHLGTEQQQGARDPAVNRTKIRILFCCCLVSRSCPTLCDSVDCSCQAPLFMGFSSQEYWSGLPFPLPEDLPDPGIEPMSPAAPALQADSLPLSHQGSPFTYVYSITIKFLKIRPNKTPCHTEREETSWKKGKSFFPAF